MPGDRTVVSPGLSGKLHTRGEERQADIGARAQGLPGYSLTSGSENSDSDSIRTGISFSLFKLV